MRHLIIKNARLVHSDAVTEGDLLLEDGRIARLGGVIERRDADEIDATGLHVLPGVIDPHVHFREPGIEHKEDLASGSRAAVRGGVTSFLEMPNTRPPTTDQQRLDDKLARAAGRSYAHFGFYIGASRSNLADLVRARRTPGIKIFVGSSTGDLLVDDQATLERIFAETTLPIATHCEEESLVQANLERTRGQTDPATHSQVRTPDAAARSVERIAELAIRHRHRTHILHLSSRAELDVLPRESGVVTGEVCIPHLFLDTSAYERLANFAKVNPALRDPADRKASWAALRAGRFANVATDHAPHTVEEKRQPYPEAPSGIPSIENSLPLMLDACHRGLLTIEEVVRYLCEGPAAVWRIQRKGRLAEGYDADLVLVDCQRPWPIANGTQWTRAGWSPWDGQVLTGAPVRTLVAGRTVVLDGALVGEPAGQPLSFAI